MASSLGSRLAQVFPMPNAALFSRIDSLSLFWAVTVDSLYAQSVVGSISNIHAPGMAAGPLRNKTYVGGTFGVIDGTNDLFNRAFV
jgi:hypothetical protein